MPTGVPPATELTTSTALASSRAASEDRLLVAQVPGGLLLVVADGAGGVGGGARAAELLVEYVHANVGAKSFGLGSERTWVELLVIADRQIIADRSAGESTAIALIVTDDLVVGASAGDSEAWIVTDGDYDVLTAAQGRRRLGSGEAAPVPFTRSFSTGTLIAGTDGLFAYAKPAAICNVARSAEARHTAPRLIDLVRLPRGGFADDAGVVAARR